MDPIPFKKVTLEEARAALKIDPIPSPKPTAAESTGKWQRRAPSLYDQELTRATFNWLAGFAKGVRPEALARTYPRIANRLAELWKKPEQCEQYFDDLLLDKRGGRQGFPAEQIRFHPCARLPVPLE